jgi:hypothetical protein
LYKELAISILEIPENYFGGVICKTLCPLIKNERVVQWVESEAEKNRFAYSYNKERGLLRLPLTIQIYIARHKKCLLQFVLILFGRAARTQY